MLVEEAKLGKREKNLLGEPGTRVALAGGRPGPPEAWKRQAARGRRAGALPALWEQAEASSRLESGLPEGCEACAWGQQTSLF